MTILICFCDYWHKRSYKQLDGNKIITEKSSLKEVDNLPSHTLKRIRFEIDGVKATYILKNFKISEDFRSNLYELYRPLQVDVLWIQVKPPKQEIIDYRWNEIISHSIWEKIEMEYLMSWLCTLGGGFSALGESESAHAITAGKISLKQLTIGVRLGDPFLQARCRLYYSLSLIQTGKLRIAKHIVRQQYKFAVKHQETDNRLVKMCKGIWLRIQYEYDLRSKIKQKASSHIKE